MYQNIAVLYINILQQKQGKSLCKRKNLFWYPKKHLTYLLESLVAMPMRQGWCEPLSDWKTCFFAVFRSVLYISKKFNPNLDGYKKVHSHAADPQVTNRKQGGLPVRTSLFRHTPICHLGVIHYFQPAIILRTQKHHHKQVEALTFQ